LWIRGVRWTLAPASFDWPTLVAAKEKEISRLSAIYRNNLDKAGVAIEDSRAESWMRMVCVLLPMAAN